MHYLRTICFTSHLNQVCKNVNFSSGDVNPDDVHVLSPFIGQSAPAAADESVYSEVKPGSSLGNNATV